MSWINFVSSSLFDAAGDDGAGGGAGAVTPGAFDAVAFKAEMLGAFNTTLNGFAKTMKADFAKLVTPKAADTTTATDTTTTDTTAAGKVVDPEKNALALELKTLKATFGDKFKILEEREAAANKKADESERDSLIRAELGKYNFAPGKAAETAFSLIKSAVTRAEDGSLVAGDLPMSKYIETELPANHSYLLDAVKVGSAGARTGKTAGGAKQYTLDDLKPEVYQKYSPEVKAEISRQIASGMNNRR